MSILITLFVCMLLFFGALAYISFSYQSMDATKLYGSVSAFSMFCLAIIASLS